MNREYKSGNTRNKRITGDVAKKDYNKAENSKIENRKARNSKTGHNKTGIKILVGVITAFVLLYVAISVYFMNHFYVATMVNEENFALKSPKSATKEIIKMIDEYQLQITGRNGLSDIITGKDIELQYQSDDGLEQIAKSQNAWLWFTGLFGKKEYDLPKTATYNEKLLKEKIKNLVFLDTKNMIKPKDAYISAYDEKTGYEIIEEEKGSTIDREQLEKRIKEAVGGVEDELDLEEADCYRNPRVTKESTELLQERDLLNQYVKTTITYDFEIAKEVINGTQIHEWISVGKKGIEFDEEAIREYINGIARKYDTYGKNRKFRTLAGKEIELLSGGYGWRVDRAAETEQLIADIEAGKDLTREMIYVTRGYCRMDNGEGGVNDIGDTYVEIDLGTQHLYVIKEGSVVEESDFVSGKLSNGNVTPPGVFGITYKERDATLSGASYESHVNYWMPFNGNIGMHDATWRKEFGGDIYITNGSHGCVNLPPEKAKIIYDLVEKGMPVVCYYE
ncbi:MAG: peptidoglycan binding domain-containing protein [Lachnospiraceae bacterium]|nr:peptidoglycan binding domain-containing protein [Lachnospiraceae bacterium]